MISYQPLKKKLIALRPEDLGITLPTYYKIWHNEPVSLQVIARICDRLGCTLSEVIRYEED